MLERSLSSSLYHWVEHEFPTNFLGKCYQLNWKQPLRGLTNIFLKTGRNLKIQFSTFEGLNTSLFCNFFAPDIIDSGDRRFADSISEI